MLNKSLAALLISSLIMSGCGSSDEKSDDNLITVPENRYPEISAEIIPVIEKRTTQLSAKVTDPDGNLKSIEWTQVGGIELELEGTNTDTITFSAPAISENSILNFLITAVDDEGLTLAFEYNTELLRIETDYSIYGSVTSKKFTSSQITVNAAGEVATSTTDENGAFDFNIAIDDDTDLSSVVSISVGNDDIMKLRGIVPQLNKLSIADSTQNSSISQMSSPTNSDSTTQKSITISALSTAQFALAQSFNNGIAPRTVEELNIAESQVQPEQLFEAAAVIKIILESNKDLPDGHQDLAAAIAEKTSYKSIIESIKSETPGLIEETINLVLNDPDLTAGIDENSLSTTYFETEPVAPTFVARSGTRFNFDTDYTGNLLDWSGKAEFEWSIVDGNIQINIQKPRLIPESVHLELFDFSNEEIALFESRGQEFVNIEKSLTTLELKRISEGSNVDVFRVTRNYELTLNPITIDGIVITAEPTTNLLITDTHFKKNDRLTESFTVEHLEDLVGLDVYTPNSDNGGTTSFNFLSFNSNNTGINLDSNETFIWSLTEGNLTLSFETFSQTTTILGAIGDDISIFTEVKNLEGATVLSISGLAIKTKFEKAFTFEDLVTGQNQYWQSMTNSWFASSWDDETLLFCNKGDSKFCDKYYNNFYGFQLRDDKTGTRFLNTDNVPPHISDYWGDNLNWSIENNIISIDFLNYCRDYDSEEVCRVRKWKVVKIEDGRIGERLYVQEHEVFEEGDTRVVFNKRWNMYEKIDVTYFNDTNGDFFNTEN